MVKGILFFLYWIFHGAFPESENGIAVLLLSQIYCGEEKLILTGNSLMFKAVLIALKHKLLSVTELNDTFPLSVYKLFRLSWLIKLKFEPFTL